MRKLDVYIIFIYPNRKTYRVLEGLIQLFLNGKKYKLNFDSKYGKEIHIYVTYFILS